MTNSYLMIILIESLLVGDSYLLYNSENKEYKEDYYGYITGEKCIQ